MGKSANGDHQKDTPNEGCPETRPRITPGVTLIAPLSDSLVTMEIGENSIVRAVSNMGGGGGKGVEREYIRMFLRFYRINYDKSVEIEAFHVFTALSRQNI